MAILGIVFLVLFIIAAVLLVLMVLVQDESGEGMGGIFAGSSNSTFGSRTGNVITRFTGVLGAMFLVFALALSFINRSTVSKGVEAEVKKASPAAQSEWWAPSTAPEALNPSPASSPAPEGTQN